MMDLFFNFEGRVGRAQYWITSLLFTAAYVPVVLVGMWAVGSGLYSFGNMTPEMFSLLILLIPLYLMVAVTATAITIKRYHDRGKSGWWFLIVLIPYIGAIWQLVELGFMKGTQGPNKYGEQY